MFLDFANAVKVQTNTSYTTPSDGVYLVNGTSQGTGDVKIDGVSIYYTTTPTSGLTTSGSFQLPLKKGTVILNTRNNDTMAYVSLFVPYK